MGGDRDSYVPLLDVLGRAPVTLSLTPVLCDQLEAPGRSSAACAFLREIRPESHRRDISPLPARRASAAGRPSSSARRPSTRPPPTAGGSLPGGLLGALGRARQLDLVGDPRGAAAARHRQRASRCRCRPGVASHRRRFGEWAGGFWLPECAYAPWLDSLLEEAGVRATCVELTGVVRARRRPPPAAARHRRRTGAVADRPRRRWRSCGARAATRRAPPTATTTAAPPMTTALWRNDGEPYDPDAARALGSRARPRLRRAGASSAWRTAGVCVCALDTELLGHWWYEGVHGSRR